MVDTITAGVVIEEEEHFVNGNQGFNFYRSLKINFKFNKALVRTTYLHIYFFSCRKLCQVEYRRQVVGITWAPLDYRDKYRNVYLYTDLCVERKKKMCPSHVCNECKEASLSVVSILDTYMDGRMAEGWSFSFLLTGRGHYIRRFYQVSVILPHLA